MQEASDLLYNFWYVAAHGSAVAAGQTQALTMLGQPVLLGRDAQGVVFALRDFCPHRGIPLRYGKFDGTTIECCYHGWCFDTQGKCTAIPSLPEDEAGQIGRIKAGSFPCQERNGIIWIYIPAPKTRLAESLPEVPVLSVALEHLLVDSVMLPCHIDHAVIGLMDPSHGPFVHQSWWWRGKKSIHLKQKHFAPLGTGFRMVSHKPSANSRAYKILGKRERRTEISFQLPGLRMEHIQLIGTEETKDIILLTALTPIDEKHTQLHQYIATNIGLVRRLLPLLKPFGKAFIRQDIRVVEMQQEGLRGEHPPLMLMGDADQQALWYYKLKKSYAQQTAEGLAFVNPLPEKLLRWRS